MNNFRLALLALIFIASTGMVSAQKKAKAIRAAGEQCYNHEQYREALRYLSKYQKMKPGDKDVAMMIGVSNLYSNNITGAKKYFNHLVQSNKKADPTALYYLAKSYHMDHDFHEAIRYYKEYLKNTKSDDAKRGLIKDDIKRCANGMRLKAGEKIAFVENMGEKINTPDEEYGMVLSPNFDDRMYFSSRRPGNMGGKKTLEGKLDERLGSYAADIFSSRIVNGEWTVIEPMNAFINTSDNDEVLDFSNKGKVMFMFQSPDLFSGHVYVDTFSNDGIKKPPSYFEGPLKAHKGSVSIDVFADSIMIFSSRQKGGYGGSDLYVSKYSNNRWSLPRNLGPGINTPYDEITPFLANDGRTLYYSSNSTRSVGGYDVFKSKYDTGGARWLMGANVGIPINSAGDETHFCLAKDAMRGYLSSSNKDSYGKRDIFIAYFTSAQNEQLAAATKNSVFYNSYFENNVASVSANGNSSTGSSFNDPSAPTEITSYKVTPLYYNDDNDVLNMINSKSLNRLGRVLLDNPGIKVELNCHSNRTNTTNFDLYFSIKRAEQVADYLVKNGVASNRILIKGMGPNYPVAKESINGNPNNRGKEFNRRVDIKLHGTETSMVKVTYDLPNVPFDMAENYLKGYNDYVKGLSYKVQMASLKQMYTSEIFTSFNDPMIEKTADERNYAYTVGLFKDFFKAEQLKKQLEASGIVGPFVIPYINGKRATQLEISSLATKYTDLYNYMSYLSRDK